MDTKRDCRHQRILDAARRYVAMGLPIIPVYGKVPAVTGWRRFTVNSGNVESWFGSRGRCGIGLRTGADSGYLVIDTDTEAAERWVLAHCPDTPMQAISGGGSRHRFFAEPRSSEIPNRQGLLGIQGLDVRGCGGFIVVAPSIHSKTGRPYEWLADVLRPDELPTFAPSWLDRRPRLRSPMARVVREDPNRLLYRARCYCARIEPAVSGSGGHNKMYCTAIKLARLVDFDPEVLWSVLQEYNTRCIPPFNERELRHKLEDALKNGRT